MRELYRAMAKAEMRRKGYPKVNRLMSPRRQGVNWRKALGIVPTEAKTGRKFYEGFYGKKRQKKGSRQPILTYTGA